MDTPLLARLRDIEQRLTRIESIVLPAAEPPPLPPVALTGGDAAPALIGALEPIGDEEPTPATTSADEQTPAARPFVLPQRPSVPSKPPMTRQRWEQLIGTRILPIVGAVAALVGVSLFLKLAYDMGWFHFPPMWRCILGFAAGGLAVAAGEWIRRRLGALASAPVSGLGLATMFAAVVAARLLYQLVPSAAALVALLAVSALGVGVASLARVRAVAVLSLLGASAAPFLLDVPEPEPAFMPIYLSMLLIAGVALAVRFPSLFNFMRTLSTALTALIGTLVALAQGHDHPLITGVFLTFVWLVHHAAQVWQCIQRDRTGNVLPRKTGITIGHAIVMTTWWAWLTGFVWNHSVLVGGLNGSAWHVTALGCCATLAGALVLAGHLRAMVDTPETHVERYGAGLTLEAGGLLFATLALAMSGWTETFAWACIGVVAALAAIWVEARRLLLYGAAALLVATVRLVTIDSALATAPNASVIATFGSALGLVFTRWMLLTWGVAAMWIVAAECARHLANTPPAQGAPPSDARAGGLRSLGVRGLGIAMLTAGAGLIGASFLHSDASTTSLIVVWLILAAVLAMTRRWIAALVPQGIATAGMLVPTFAWAAAFPLGGWFKSQAPLLLHPGLWTLAAVFAAGFIVLREILAGMAREVVSRSERRAVTIAFASCALLLTLIATSLEVARIAGMFTDDQTAQAASLSVWWGLFATALIVIGMAQRLAALRWAGLVLMGAALCKLVFYDLREITPVWRIVSFIAVGGLMLAVGLWYSSRGRRLFADANATPP